MSRVLTHVCEFEVCVIFEIRRKCHCSVISLLIPYLITRIFRTKTWVLVTPVNSSAKFWVYQVVMKLRKDIIQHGFLGKRYWVTPCSSQSSDTSFRIKQRTGTSSMQTSSVVLARPCPGSWGDLSGFYRWSLLFRVAALLVWLTTLLGGELSCEVLFFLESKGLESFRDSPVWPRIILTKRLY